MTKHFLIATNFGARTKRVMLRHNILCRYSGARHCVVARPRARDIHALSQQCGVVLCRDRESHARSINQAGRARKGRRTKAGRA